MAPARIAPALFEASIARVAREPSERAALRELLVRVGVTETLAGLAALARSERYEPEPARETRVAIGGRARVVLRSRGVDAVLERALAAHLTERAEGALHDGVHSYRAGRSSGTAVRAIAARVRALRSADPRGDLFVLRRDVRAYGESIPTHDASSLWPALASLLPDEPWLLRPIRSFVRRTYASADGAGARWETGAPNGSYLQPLVNNLYLDPADRLLGAEGAAYARYGDDLVALFSTPDAARDVSARLDALAGALGLEFGEKKRTDLALVRNGTARPAEGFTPTGAFEFLGYAVTARGGVALAKRHGRDLVRFVRGRVHNAMCWARGAPLARRLELAVLAASGALDPQGELGWPRLGQLGFVDDRPYLAHLDALVALAVAEACTGVRGVRAFRAAPPRALAAAGLPSLVRRRNDSGAP